VLPDGVNLHEIACIFVVFFWSVNHAACMYSCILRFWENFNDSPKKSVFRREKKNATNLFTGIKTDPAEEKNCFSGIFVAENKLFSAEK
jgi:hypothetical protein